MPQVTMGDLAQTTLFGHRNATLKDSIQSLSTETTTGLTTETTKQVRGDYSALSGIEASLTQLGSFKIVTSETAALASHMQLALNSISDSGSTLSASLLAAATSNSPARIDALGVDADHRLRSALSALNSRFADKSVFAGNLIDRGAVSDADTLLTALTTAVSGARTAADAETAVNAWFDDPAGFVAAVYQGGAPLSAVNVGPEQQVQIDVTATDPAIISMIKGFAMSSLLQRGVFAGDDASRADLAKRAGVSLSGSMSSMAELTGRLGTTEADLLDAQIRYDAEKTALETARLGLIAVDPYETASKLQAAQTQLEALYSITARMSRLSLVNYL